jgi:hypothetical protein
VWILSWGGVLVGRAAVCVVACGVVRVEF